MNRDEILAALPGIELDKEVYEKLFGGDIWWDSRGRIHAHRFPFSSSIAAAFEVVYMMLKKGYVSKVCVGKSGAEAVFTAGAVFTKDRFRPWVFRPPDYAFASGDTAPEAIIKAALLALEGK